MQQTLCQMSGWQSGPWPMEAYAKINPAVLLEPVPSILLVPGEYEWQQKFLKKCWIFVPGRLVTSLIVSVLLLGDWCTGNLPCFPSLGLIISLVSKSFLKFLCFLFLALEYLCNPVFPVSCFPLCTEKAAVSLCQIIWSLGIAHLVAKRFGLQRDVMLCHSEVL